MSEILTGRHRVSSVHDVPIQVYLVEEALRGWLAGRHAVCRLQEETLDVIQFQRTRKGAPMKRIALSILVAGGLVSAGTFAAPIVLPNAPIFLQFVDAEQFSATNDIGNAANPTTFHPAAGTEGTWGVVQVTSMQLGTVLNPLGSDIQGGGSTFFSNGQNGGNQVLGIFHSIHTDG